MKVTLSVDALTPQPGGIGRYTWRLCQGLATHPDIEELHFVAQGRSVVDPASLVRGEAIRRGGLFRRKLETARTRRLLARTLVHGPNYFLPANAETGVITVHDLSVFRFPETHPAERVRAFEREFTSSLRRAAHIITDTETVRRELIAGFGVAETKVSAVWLGVDPTFRPRTSTENAAALSALDLVPDGYALCVSTLEPRKRIAELISAWRLLPTDVRNRYPLVLAGGSGWRNDELRSLIVSAAAEGWLRPLGFVDEALLPALYAGARLFTYPSIYEGFGLPPLEAMASGVPVVVSNQSCMPEVCGDGASYVTPEDVTGFSAQLEQCLVDEQWRASAIKNGLMRARLFDWNRCIEGTVLAYRRATSVLQPN